MTLCLVRLDDRLLHGQVVVGWGQALGVDAFVLVDDVVRADPGEQALYEMGMPPGAHVTFASGAEAEAAVSGWIRSPRRMILVVGDVETLARLCEHVPDIERVNVGGLHWREGRTERLRYVFLDPHEADRLRALGARGVTVTAQDVPTAVAVKLADLV